MATFLSRKNRVPVHGVLLLDKSAGYSSNDALIQAKRLLNAEKAGHTGTLDPFATGLLPLCFGEATKFAQDLLDADKTYETVVHLGMTTTTGDTEGEVVTTRAATAGSAQPSSTLPLVGAGSVTEGNVTGGNATPRPTPALGVTRDQIESVLARFRGELDQIPPMYSALKRDGKPLYEYARAGVVLERAARRVTIHDLELLDYRAPYLTLRVTCSKGTYIRVLGEDIGLALGCGAHLHALRRTGVGSLSIDHAVTLDAFAGLSETGRVASLSAVDALLSLFPAVSLPEQLATRFLHGQRLSLGREGMAAPAAQGRVRVYREPDGKLLGTGQMTEFGVLAPERLIATK
jgi:tRNA pseudouridine55 synthase